MVLLLLSVDWLSDFMVSTWVCFDGEMLCDDSGEAGLIEEWVVLYPCDWLRFVLECLSDTDNFDNGRPLSPL